MEMAEIVPGMRVFSCLHGWPHPPKKTTLSSDTQNRVMLLPTGLSTYPLKNRFAHGNLCCRPSNTAEHPAGGTLEHTLLYMENYVAHSQTWVITQWVAPQRYHFVHRKPCSMVANPAEHPVGDTPKHTMLYTENCVTQSPTQLITQWVAP